MHSEYKARMRLQLSKGMFLSLITSLFTPPFPSHLVPRHTLFPTERPFSAGGESQLIILSKIQQIQGPSRSEDSYEIRLLSWIFRKVGQADRETRGVESGRISGRFAGSFAVVNKINRGSPLSLHERTREREPGINTASRARSLVVYFGNIWRPRDWIVMRLAQRERP